jgi:peptidoglycan/xylan/chitin deacetylase (PgdA/CDA1 family)
MAVVALVALLVAVLSGGSGPSHRRSAAGAGRSGFDPRHAQVPAAPILAGPTAEQTAAINRVLDYTPYIAAGSRRRRDVALTFDDGPSNFTPQVLDILRRERAPATFFQIGREARQYPAIAREVLAAGLPIGDHTETHPLLGALSPKAQKDQVVAAARAIQSYGAPYPRLFRPPYGSFNAATLAVLRPRHMLMVLWSVDTRDFSQPGVSRIVYTALSGAKPGAIILMHDGGGPRGQTVAALPRIIHGLRKRHLHIVTVPQLIVDDPPLHQQAKPHSLTG